MVALASDPPKVRPIEDRVLLKMAVADVKTPGGLLLPVKDEFHDTRGTVIAVGPGARDMQGNIIPMTVKVGDVVMISPFQGKAIQILIGNNPNDKDQWFVVVPEPDILLILD